MNREEIIHRFLLVDPSGQNYKFPVEVGAMYNKDYMDALSESDFKRVILQQLKKTQVYALAQFNELIDEIENDGRRP